MSHRTALLGSSKLVAESEAGFIPVLFRCQVELDRGFALRQLRRSAANLSPLWCDMKMSLEDTRDVARSENLKLEAVSCPDSNRLPSFIACLPLSV